MKFSPGCSMRVKAPKRSTVQTWPCDTVFTPANRVTTTRISRRTQTIDGPVPIMVGSSGMIRTLGVGANRVMTPFHCRMYSPAS